VALTNAYHGSSTGSASLTGLATFHRGFEPMMPEALRMARRVLLALRAREDVPECALACADDLERVVAAEGASRIGAVIVEPIQGVGGVVVPPPGWLERVRALCDRHDLLLVVDEVITGFGRTGTWFGFQHWDVVPDMVVFAKGVTSGYQPLGGVVLHERVWRVFADAGPTSRCTRASRTPATRSPARPASRPGRHRARGARREGRVATARTSRAPRDARRARRSSARSGRSGSWRRSRSSPIAPRAARSRPRRRCRAASATPRAAAGSSAVRTPKALMLCPPLVTTRQQLDEIVGIVRASIVEIAARLD
jgi:adenosylmethionine-8-amino-7-oxononanoate aminotransferase